MVRRSRSALTIAAAFAAAALFEGFASTAGTTSSGLPPLARLMSEARAQSPQVRDIVGLEPGQSVDRVVELLKKRDDSASIEIAQQWIRQSHGVPTRQLLRASNGVPCAPGEAIRQDGSDVHCDTLGQRFEARKSMSNEIIVAFVGMPGNEVVASIWRRTVYAKGANPSVAALETALAEKYGRPHIRQTESGYYSTTHRLHATNLNWVFAPDQRPIRNDDATRQRCVNGPKPWFTTRHSWNRACGLTIRAEIRPDPANRLLARELNVMVVHQRNLIDRLGRFDADLKAAVESQAGRGIKKGDL